MSNEEDSFAFIIHPIDPKRDVSRKFPFLGRTLPIWLINFLSLFFPPIYISEIRGIRSQATGGTAKGWLIACPLTPDRMMSLKPAIVYRKIVQTGRMAERLGAKLLGLGAFTSVVGDGGITISNQLDIPVTTGDSYTVAVAVEAIEKAAAMMGQTLSSATVAVVGGAGAIGAVCAQMLAPKVGRIILIGRTKEKLQPVASKIEAAGRCNVNLSNQISDLKEAHLIITVTSAVDAIIEPHHLRPGAVVCDVARPRDVSRQVVEKRPDVLVIEGGMVQVPGEVDFGFNFGFPEKMAFACMAETIALSLEKRYEPFTLGKTVQLSQVMTIDRIAKRHGFTLGGFRSFEKEIPLTQIEQVKIHALAASER